MRSFKISIAIASGVLALSAGVAFADDLHNLVPSPTLIPEHDWGSVIRGRFHVISC